MKYFNTDRKISQWRVVEGVFPKWSDIIADTKRGSLWRPLRKLYKKAKAARRAALGNSGPAPSSQTRSQAQTQPQTQAVWGATPAPPESQFGGLESTIDYMAIDPTLAADAESIRPRLITDMIISESSAHTLSSAPPPLSYAPISSGNTTTSTNLSTLPQGSRGDIQMNMGGSASFHYDDVTSEQGQSIVHALLGWPELGYGMPPALSVGAPGTV